MKFNDRQPRREDDFSLKSTQSHDENILLRSSAAPEDQDLAKTQSNADYCVNCGELKQDHFHICVTAVLDSADAFHDRHLGQIVGGHYVIDKKLGEGGMSVVYRAKHELLNKVVAVKVLKSTLSMDRGKLARFQQEALSVSKLNHPNIIRVYHFEVPSKSEPYLIMDYVDGEPLSDLLEREGPISLDRTIAIFSQVCGALAHAHESGVVHRDIKPSNIIICFNEDGTETVKIVDFGIAKIVTGEGEQQNVTQTGEVFGSPLYMSPEQCAAKQMDARSDIYSTACVIYECLTGAPPLMGASALETMQMHVFEMPENVTKKLSAMANAARLDALMFKALAKHPARRHESMKELQLELESLKDDYSGGIVSDAMSRLEVYQRKRGARAWKSRVQPFLAPLIAATVGLCCVSALALYQAFNPPRDWQTLNIDGQRLFDQAKYDDARQRFESALNVSMHAPANKRTDETISALQELTDLDKVENKSVAPIMARLAALRPPGAGAKSAPIQTVSSNRNDEFAQVNERFRSLGMDNLQVASMLADLKKLQPTNKTEADGLINQAIDLAGIETVNGRLDSAEKLANTALAASHRVYGEAKIADLRAMGDFTLINIAKNDFESAKTFAEQSLALADTLKSPSFKARAYLALAEIAEHQHKFAQSLKLTEQAAAIFRQVDGSTSKWMALCHYRAASVYDQTDKFTAAERDYQQALDVLKELPPESLPGATIDTELALGRLKVNHLSDQSGARSLFESAIAQLEAKEPKTVVDWRSLVKALTSLAFLESQSSRPAVALPLARRASAISERVETSRGELFADTLRAIAQAQWQSNKKGMLQKADEDAFHAAIEATQSASPGDEAKLVPCYQEMSIMYFAHKDYLKAEQVLMQSLNLQKNGDKELRDKTISLLENARARQGKPAEANAKQK